MMVSSPSNNINKHKSGFLLLLLPTGAVRPPPSPPQLSRASHSLSAQLAHCRTAATRCHWVFGPKPAMKYSAGLGLLLVCSLIGVGSAIRCYSCKDYTASCGKQRDCSYDDACLTLTERGGMTVRKCLKYTDCDRSRLSQMFPSIQSFTFKCCNYDLCNSAPTSAASSLIGLLSSVFVLWWCFH